MQSPPVVQEQKVAAPVQASPQVVAWLDKLEAKGKQVRSLQASVQYEKLDELIGEEQTRIGTVNYLSADPPTPTRFTILFKQFIVDDRVHNQQLEYVFDGKWLVQKDYAQKYYEKRQVVATNDPSGIDPLDIDGPFPIPLGQKRQSVLQRFNVMEVTDDATENPKGLIHLRLIPRKDVPEFRGQKKFEQVDMWFDRVELLPTRVVSDEGQAITTVTLKNIKVNQLKYDPKVFDISAPAGEGWKQEIKPWED